VKPAEHVNETGRESFEPCVREQSCSPCVRALQTRDVRSRLDENGRDVWEEAEGVRTAMLRSVMEDDSAGDS
jgi:hypothetical protein